MFVGQNTLHCDISKLLLGNPIRTSIVSWEGAHNAKTDCGWLGGWGKSKDNVFTWHRRMNVLTD